MPLPLFFRPVCWYQRNVKNDNYYRQQIEGRSWGKRMATIASTPASSGAPGGLIGLIASLQQQQNTRYGRLNLLDFARKRARAQLGLLFRYDSGELMLVEHCGRAPHNLSIPAGATLSGDGLFGSARGRSGLVSMIADHADLGCLPAERAWTWHNGRILLCAVATSAATEAPLAVMALCARPQVSLKPLSRQAEQDILLCAVLLASYAEDTEPDTTGEAYAQSPAPDARKGRLYILHDHLPTGGNREAAIDYAAMLQHLAGFYERGLAGGRVLSEQALCQGLLDDLRDRLEATGGALWLYSPSQRRFVPRAEAELDDASALLLQDELTRIATEGVGSEEPGTGESRWPRIVTWSQKRMLVAYPLDVEGERERTGIVGLSFKSGADLTMDQRLLLERLCQAAAVIVRQQQQFAARQQEAIDEERNRIARDIHDGAVQQIAHVLHALEYAGRVVERQPDVARQEVLKARESLVESLGSLRQSIASLLPAQLERASIDEALDALLDEFRRAHPAVQVTFEGGKLKNWPPSLEAPVYRVIQEALNNAGKHAQAGKAVVRIQSLTGLLVVQVSDNGVGFDVAQARGNASGEHGGQPHFGLRSMQERVEQAGGTFALTSDPGKGTSIKAGFPLPALSTTLTQREREVLRLLVAGSTNRVIAGQLFVSVETVKSHMHHIMQKLGVKDRTQAAVLAARQQWV